MSTDEPITLEDRMDEIKHRRLNLRPDGAVDGTEANPHRPEIGVWGGLSAYDQTTGADVAVSIGALWGQPIRFIEMTPEEARALARDLIIVAGQVSACRRVDQAGGVAAGGPRDQTEEDHIDDAGNLVAPAPAAHTDAFAPESDGG